MNKQKNNNQKSLLPLVCLFVVLVVIALALLVVLLLDKEPSQSNENTTAPTIETTAPTVETTAPQEETQSTTEAPTETTQPPTVPAATGGEGDLQIETPYATLYYPGDWEPFLEVQTSQEQGYSVTFVAKLNTEGDERIQNLFRLTFEGAGDHFVGTLQTEDGSAVTVELEIFEFRPDESWSNSESNIVFSMQDAVNHVLSCMNLDRTVKPEDEVIAGKDERMEVETPHGKLYYPARWEEYLMLKTEAEDPYTLTFCCKLEGREEQPLFTIYFGGEQGVPAKTIVDSNGKTVEIRLGIISFEPDDTWSDEEIGTVYAMQEDMNVLLSNLK